uniref:NADH-ubiquinone oxidoreductase chain 4 n=1 Tax=Triraphis sp. QL-2013 TaxID=1421602 RepID=A0A0A6ZKX3_9HYME|nr:NADH dehydrogenase subunit 4 [Triraphis sp. QL-2013]
MKFNKMMKMIFLLISLNFNSILIKNFFLNILIMNIMFINFLNFLINNNFKNYYWLKINMMWGMDYMKLNLSLLTIWILWMSTISNNNFLQKNNNLMFMNIMIFLSSILIMCFCSMNLMIFYITFETSLIPILMIIMGWGYQIDRIQASMYMLFYTLFGSLPLLTMIMFMYFYFKTFMMSIMWMNNNTIYLNNFIIYLMIILAFMIKMPMYLTHLWLPKAHVEAPISGSMILAGVMLKLGSYGLYRFMFIVPNLFMMYSMNTTILAIIGSLISSLICLNQTDLKIMVAYSSIVHMSILLASMLTMTKMSIMGSLWMMIAHGLCSAGMFFLVNCNYERTMSRNILINKGLINLFPSLSMWWFLIYSSNFSAPPSLNLFSEILLFNSLIQFNNSMMPFIMLTMFFSTCYSIFIFAFSQYGKLNYSFFNFKAINCKEFLLSFLLWMPLNFMFLNLNLF